MTHDLVIRNAHVVTCAGAGPSAKERLGIVPDGAIAIRGDRIAWIGADADRPRDAAREIDAGRRVVLPGLVDAHTHLVFAGTRIDELARKMAGEDYRAIAASGGGIAASVRATRAASEDELFARAKARALAMRACGTTTVEVKSGYGLDLATETRLLAVGRRLAREGVVSTTTTFLGAHAIPPERAGDREGYLRDVIDVMIPAIAEAKLADACDVYLDENAFTRDEAGRVLSAAKARGWLLKAHIGQFRDLGGAELLAELGALSGDHLEDVSDAGLRAMASAGVRAVLLPGAWRTLRQKAPDAARMRAHGVAMVVATDCNPGTSACVDLPLCAALAVRDAGLTLEEALLAITVEAAGALGLADRGRIAVGARADLACYDESDPRALAYALGGTRARWIALGGRVIEDADRTGHDRALW
ncbi:imidazolonepropionase [Sandaracinus amylolyticus]|uniref:Imidazolonepropionase n=1 Tax=Sandaracinus amylolyticus TaxID=927083 RepID=A0A0F6SFB6_9BACT|nr:imidazolonepropionase [Sandaracinus amylolyticus]AKF06659.1 Imidazolonepropionase [Sandaracinus amylolyticus]